MQAWRAIRSLRSAAAFGSWLRQIAVNAWLRHQRDTEQFAMLEDAHEPMHHPVTSKASHQVLYSAARGRG